MSDEGAPTQPSDNLRAVVTDATLTEIKAFLLACIVDDIVALGEVYEVTGGAPWDCVTQEHTYSIAEGAAFTTSPKVASFLAVHASPSAVQQAAQFNRELLLLIERRSIEGDAVLRILLGMLWKYDTYEGFDVRWRNKIERVLFGAAVSPERQRAVQAPAPRPACRKQDVVTRKPVRLYMPRVAGSRVLAAKLVTDANFAPGASVIVDGHSVIRFSPGFLRSLVDALVHLSPAEVLFDSGPPSWHQEARVAAEAAGLTMEVRTYYPPDAEQRGSS